MDLLNEANPLREFFTASGASHCGLGPAGGGVLIARNKPAVGAYTVDVYVKGTGAGSKRMFVVLSKGIAEDIGLPVAPFGNAWPDGDGAWVPEKLTTIYDSFTITTDWTWSVEQVPGSDPNIVHAVVTPIIQDAGSFGVGMTATTHRHAYSAADWVTGLVKYDPSNIDQPWDGGVCATKILPLPLSRKDFWKLFVDGALSKVRSDAADKIRAECVNAVFGVDMDVPATFGLDFYWDAKTGRMYVGRGMGSHSVTGESGTPYANNIATQGEKVVNGTNVKAVLSVRHVDMVISTHDSPQGALVIPPYNLSYKRDVGTGRVLLRSSAAGGKVLTDLTRLCSEVFPVSFDRELDSSFAYVDLDEVFAAAAETAAGTAANALQEQSQSSGSTPSMPKTGASTWHPKYQDFASVCMQVFEVAARAASNG